MKFKGKSLIDNLGKITTGKTPSTKNSEYWNGNIPFITPKDLQGSKHIISTERKITKLGAATVKGSIIPINSVCVSCIGVIGYVGITTTESVSNQQINSIIVNENNDTDYVYYLMKWLWPYFKNYEGQSTTLSILNKTHFSKIEIPIHPLDYQRKVSKLLSMIDDKIALNHQINKNLEEQLNIVYHQIFDKEKDFLELGVAIKTTSGGTPARKQEEFYRDAHICWVKSKELTGGYIFDTEEKINDIAIKNSSAKMLPTHSVLIAMYGATVGEFAIITKPMACNQAICALLDSDTYPYTYLYQFVKEEKAHLLNMAVGSAQQNISQILIKQLPIHANTEKVKKYHSLVKPIHEQKEALGKECTVLSDLRDALLPHLMSGEIDVSKIEI